MDMFADPVKLDVEKVTKVDNYGTGLAPYFLSLGLYVGAMLLTIVYSVREPAVRPRERLELVLEQGAHLGAYRYDSGAYR